MPRYKKKSSQKAQTTPETPVQSAPELGSNSQAQEELPVESAQESGLGGLLGQVEEGLSDENIDGVGDFLSSVNNYERLWAAENSMLGYHETASKFRSKDQQEKDDAYDANRTMRNIMGAELHSMMDEGSISAGEVQHTYQSSHDKGNDFGGEVALSGVWGEEYVLHGHYGGDGSTKSGSVGLKKASDAKGLRLAHGIDDALGGDKQDLKDHWDAHKPAPKPAKKPAPKKGGRGGAKSGGRGGPKSGGRGGPKGGAAKTGGRGGSPSAKKTGGGRGGKPGPAKKSGGRGRGGWKKK